MCFIFGYVVWVNVYAHMSVAGDYRRPQIFQGVCLCQWVFDCGHLGSSHSACDLCGMHVTHTGDQSEKWLNISVRKYCRRVHYWSDLCKCGIITC